MKISLFGCKIFFLEKFTITDPEGEPYLVRYILIKSKWLTIYLHHILSPDFDREMHDHPWNFLSLVVRGGYIEEVESPTDLQGLTCIRYVYWMNWKWAEQAHRICKVLPNTWTLILCGPRRRDWGFHTEKGWVHWREFLDSKFGAGKYEAGPQL